MNKKHRVTLGRIFSVPTRPDMAWSDIEALFLALGATIEERQGSRVLVKLKGRRAVFHRPHPRREAKRGAVRAAREFLKLAGVMP
jgi:hypothetical protein